MWLMVTLARLVLICRSHKTIYEYNRRLAWHIGPSVHAQGYRERLFDQLHGRITLEQICKNILPLGPGPVQGYHTSSKWGSDTKSVTNFMGQISVKRALQEVARLWIWNRSLSSSIVDLVQNRYYFSRKWIKRIILWLWAKGHNLMGVS